MAVLYSCQHAHTRGPGHPGRIASQAAADLVAFDRSGSALLNYVSERAVLFEPMAPEALLRAAFAPPNPRSRPVDRPIRQRAYLDAFLSAVALSESVGTVFDEPARELVVWISWSLRRVDAAIR